MIAFSLVYGKSGGKKFPRSIIKGNDASFSFLWSGRLLFSEFLNLGAVQTEGSEYTHCSQFPVKWMRAGAPFSSELFLTAVRSPHLIPRRRRKAMCCLPSEGGVYHYTFLEQNWTLENVPRLLILLALQYLQWLEADWVHCGSVDSLEPSQHRAVQQIIDSLWLH